MKILIVENEIYLAQSINAKLTEFGHHCDIASSTKDAIKNNYFDVVLLSTNISSQDFYPVLNHYTHSIIILMVSYISNDTVTKPIEKGASDYILKPFMIEELIRKINHYREYEHLRNQNNAFEKYLDDVFLSYTHDLSMYETSSLPFILSSSQPRIADSFAYQLGKKFRKPFTYISLEEEDAFIKIQQSSKKNLIYLTNFQTLRRSQKEVLVDLIINRYAIIATTKIMDGDQETGLPIIKLQNDNTFFEDGEIMPIHDYVKYIVTLHQDKLPDTELSKKLGISRKSLWEKRKRYGLVKQK